MLSFPFYSSLFLFSLLSKSIDIKLQWKYSSSISTPKSEIQHDYKEDGRYSERTEHLITRLHCQEQPICALVRISMLILLVLCVV